jgi:hypothetical protein
MNTKSATILKAINRHMRSVLKTIKYNWANSSINPPPQKKKKKKKEGL